MNSQMFSTELSSGHLAGNAMILMFDHLRIIKIFGARRHIPGVLQECHDDQRLLPRAQIISVIGGVICPNHHYCDGRSAFF
jgi:hypothetical protein